MNSLYREIVKFPLFFPKHGTSHSINSSLLEANFFPYHLIDLNMKDMQAFLPFSLIEAGLYYNSHLDF